MPNRIGYLKFMHLTLELLNLNTSTKLIKAILCLIGLNLLLSFSGVESAFQGGQLQVVKSSDLYCLSGEVTSGKPSNTEAALMAFLVSAVTSDHASSALGLSTQSCQLVRPAQVKMLWPELFTLKFRLGFSKPSRAPPVV